MPVRVKLKERRSKLEIGGYRLSQGQHENKTRCNINVQELRTSSVGRPVPASGDVWRGGAWISWRVNPLSVARLSKREASMLKSVIGHPSSFSASLFDPGKIS